MHTYPDYKHPRKPNRTKFSVVFAALRRVLFKIVRRIHNISYLVSKKTFQTPSRVRKPKGEIRAEISRTRVASRAEPSRVKTSRCDPSPDLQCPARAKSSRVMESRAKKRALSRAAISSRTDPSFESGRFLYRALGW